MYIVNACMLIVQTIQRDHVRKHTPVKPMKSQEVLPKEADDTALLVFNVTDAEIAEIQEVGLTLTTNGVDDKPAYDLVYKAAQHVKSLRTSIEKARKELKEPHLERGRVIDKEAKRLSEQLLPVANHLQEQRGLYEREQERIKQEKLHTQRAELQRRHGILTELGCVVPTFQLEAASPEEFDALVADAKAEHQEREAEKREREQAAKDEAEKLKAEREELGKLKKDQLERESKLDAERAEVYALRNRAKAEATAAARATEDAKREVAEAEARAKADKAKETARKAAVKRERAEAAKRQAADVAARTHVCPKCQHSWTVES